MQKTRLDRMIGWLSPAAGAKRAQARMLMATLGYEGAKQGRRTDGWVTLSTDADTESQSVVYRLRDRARDLVRNNPYAASAVDVRSTEVIGAGIVAEVEHKGLAKMWEIFVENCDADGALDFYGMQALIERCRMESGEVLVRFVNVARTSDEIKQGLVPVQLRVMEPDFIDQSRDGRAENGNTIRYGIEYDASHRAVAYYLYHRHPGEGTLSYHGATALQSSRVPANEILHLYRRLRPGQSRGVTDFAPVMARLRNLDDYDDAEVMRKKLEACLAAFVTTPAGPQASPLGSISTDSTGRVETLYPGMVSYMAHGEDVTFADPKASGGYAEFKRFSARDIATGLGLPYELMTGDLSQVNYSSYRAGLIRFRRRLEQDQWHMYVPGLCTPVFNRFATEARAMRGAPSMGLYKPVAWTPPRFELIDPLKETQAELESVLAGFDTWDEVVRKRGWTATEQLESIEKWQKQLDQRGIVLKSDHRTAVAQVAQSAAPAEPDDDEQTTDEEEAA